AGLRRRALGRRRTHRRRAPTHPVPHRDAQRLAHAVGVPRVRLAALGPAAGVRADLGRTCNGSRRTVRTVRRAEPDHEGRRGMGKPAEGRTIVDTALGRVEYVEHGEGRPVLFVHGSPGGCDQGAVMTEFLAARGFRTISLSRPGYLGTPLNDDVA